MNNLITRNKSMGRQQCKKHPKHRQSPGVCSLCLSDKLSKVSTKGTASRAAIIRARARLYYHYSSSSSSSSISSYESSISSTPASPLHYASSTARHRRIVSDVRATIKEGSSVGKGSFFSKSKSIAHVERSNNDDDANKKKNLKKNVRSLWANLLRLGRNEQKRINAEEIDRKMLIVSKQQQYHPHQLASSSSMVVH